GSGCGGGRGGGVGAAAVGAGVVGAAAVAAGVGAVVRGAAVCSGLVAAPPAAQGCVAFAARAAGLAGGAATGAQLVTRSRVTADGTTSTRNISTSKRLTRAFCPVLGATGRCGSLEGASATRRARPASRRGRCCRGAAGKGAPPDRARRRRGWRYRRRGSRSRSCRHGGRRRSRSCR